MRRLRVGLNLVPIGERAGGVGSYAAELTAALAARDDVEVHVFVGRDTPDTIVPRGIRASTKLPVRLSGPPLHLAAQFAAIPGIALLRRLDVVHSPANAGPVRIPGVASVVTLHDTIWARAPADWGSASAVRSMYRVALPTARRADRVIAVSGHAAADLRALFGLPADRIDVIHHGVRVDPSAPATDERELRARLGLEDAPVVLCVAQKRPYKNQEVLVRALADERLAMARLVLPGAPTPYESRLRELAEELGVGDRLHLPDWLPDSDLEGLYRLAACCAIPSRLEGFGLPVLEAMARAVPVACSDRTALPEVAGEAALLFDPDEPAAVVDALARLLGDPELRRALSALGLARAARFTWAAAADATVASYRSAVAQRRAASGSL
jgi:glycosyltransferase involved in cell wall biosynthesis